MRTQKSTKDNNLKFIETYDKLNAEQKEAVNTTEGVVMVIAGPGTGKTEVLTVRIANIIEKGLAKPEEILALTFTESGVASMKNRLIDLIGMPGYKVVINTFHGFANNIIKEYPEQFDEIIGSVNITDIEQIKILKKIIDSFKFEKLNSSIDRYYYVKEIKKQIETLKKEAIDPQKFKELIDDEKNTILNKEDLYYEKGAYKGKMKSHYKTELENCKKNGELAIIYEAYEKALRDNSYYDYNDMIMYVSKALQNNEDIRMELQEKYKYILVDEHQDTNEAQNKIIEFLGNGTENPNIFLVGDEKQAIYKFQGASRANFEYFKKKYKNIKIFVLKNNYRSTQTILNAAQTLFPKYEELFAKNEYPEKKILIVETNSKEIEYYFIARKIEELIKNGTSPEEIAVLYRDNKDANPVARILEKQNIQVNIESDQEILNDTDIEKLLKIFKTIQRFGYQEELPGFLQIDFLEILPLDFYKIINFSFKQRMNTYDVIKSKELLQKINVEEIPKMLEIYNKLSEWKIISQNTNALEAFEKIINDSGFLIHILKSDHLTEKMAKLNSIFEYLKSLVETQENYKLNDFFEHIDLLRENNIAIKNIGPSATLKRVRLMTAHKSKGLQFEYVFIINAIDGKWGSKRKANLIKLPNNILKTVSEVQEDEESNDEEKNIFYVALTRAKKEVFITFSKINRDKREQTHTQFINEIKPELIEKYDTELIENKFLENIQNELTPPSQNKLEIKDKDFLNALFEKQGLSATAINNYLNCPWRYFYENLIKIPRATNKSLSFGNAIHQALKNFFDKRNTNKEIGKEYLIRKFEEALDEEAIDEKDFEELLEKGKKILSEYYEDRKEEWIYKTINELSINDVKFNGNIKLNGKIDKIEIIDNKNDIQITDYKTGKSKSKNNIEGMTKNKGAGDYKRQILFYNILLENYNEYKILRNYIDFVENDKNGKNEKIEVSVSKTDIEEFKKQIIEIVEEIRNLSFWNKTCEDPDCPYCKIRKQIES
jgi:DNA helicase-2/ATP-dependent DNA helicase PcrA